MMKRLIDFINVEYTEHATMILNDYALYTPRPLTAAGEILEKRANSIFVGLISHCGRSVRTDDFRKINLMINSNSNNKFTKGLSTLAYHVKGFDINALLELPIDVQKGEILNHGYRWLEDVFDTYELDVNSLLGAKEVVKERNFTNIYSGKKSHYKNNTIQVVALQGFQNTQLILKLKRRRNDIIDIPIRSLDGTSPFLFNIHLKKPVWISQSKVKIFNDDEDIIIDINAY